MARGNKVHIGSQFDDRISGPLAKIRDQFDRLGKNKGAQAILQGVGLGIGTSAINALGRGVGKLTDFVFDSIAAASDLNETISKGRVIFGANAVAIEAWAETAASAFGQSKAQAIDTASGFAGLFKTVGLGLDESTTLAQKLTELGSDLASFFNTDVEQALLALKSGLAGESEPLRKFNVFLSETAVSAKLVEMGVQKVGGRFTEAQKATARYALIMEQTTDAQGDYSRTSGNLATLQKSLNAEIANLSAELGTELLPIMRDLTAATLGFVKALNDLPDPGNWWDDATRGAQDFIDTLPKSEYSLRKQEAEVRKLNARLHFVAPAFEEAGDAAVKMADTSVKSGKRVERSLQDIVDAAKKTRNDLVSVGQDTADVLYDPLIARAELAANEREQAEQRAIIANKKSTAEQVADAKLRLLELTKTNIGLQTQLASFGAQTKAEQEKFIRDLSAKWRSSSAEGRANIDLLIQSLARLRLAAINANLPLGRITEGSGIGTGSGGRASGGPVRAGGRYTVGEEGTEDLLMFPGGGGFVIPRRGAGQRAGGGDTRPVSIDLKVDGATLARIVDEHLYYRRA